MTENRLSSLQLELLKIYSFEPTEEELKEIQAWLARFFADRLVQKVDSAIKAKHISEDDLEKWLNEQD